MLYSLNDSLQVWDLLQVKLNTLFNSDALPQVQLIYQTALVTHNSPDSR